MQAKDKEPAGLALVRMPCKLSSMNIKRFDIAFRDGVFQLRQEGAFLIGLEGQWPRQGDVQRLSHAQLIVEETGDWCFGL